MIVISNVYDCVFFGNNICLIWISRMDIDACLFFVLQFPSGLMRSSKRSIFLFMKQHALIRHTSFAGKVVLVHVCKAPFGFNSPPISRFPCWCGFVSNVVPPNPLYHMCFFLELVFCGIPIYINIPIFRHLRISCSRLVIWCCMPFCTHLKSRYCFLNLHSSPYHIHWLFAPWLSLKQSGLSIIFRWFFIQPGRK